MAQLCVRFNQKTEQKLRQRAANKEITVANYIRNLVDLGMRVEDASKEKKQEDEANKTREELQLKSYKATIESLLIVRRLLGYTNNTNDNSEDILKFLSEKAQTYIDGYLGENV